MDHGLTDDIRTKKQRGGAKIITTEKDSEEA